MNRKEQIKNSASIRIIKDKYLFRGMNTNQIDRLFDDRLLFESVYRLLVIIRLYVFDMSTLKSKIC